AASGTLLFADGEATKTVQVTVNGDSAVEPNESFKLVVTPAGGTGVMGLATIVTDDVSIAVNDVTATEGDASTRFIDAFVSAGSGGLATPRHLAFGPDGKLYVASQNSDEVLRYDAATGNFLDVAIPSTAGLDGPWSLDFGPDGNLYVGGL